MKWLLPAILACVFQSACGSSTSTPIGRDASPVADATTSIQLPEVPPGCPPSSGNDIGIGKPCTATGTECTGSLQCSCKSWFGYTMPASMPCFCTSVTFGTTCSSCGTDAPCCTYNVPVSTTTITVSACFPGVCAPGGQCPSITP